jgi:Family of unknown function (DUF6131)
VNGCARRRSFCGRCAPFLLDVAVVLFAPPFSAVDLWAYWPIRKHVNGFQEYALIVLGIILILVGYLLPVPGIIATIGWILLVIGLVLLVLGQIGRPIGGRRYWY